MRRNKQTFNNLLRRYHKYFRKIENLRLANRNERRQAILAKHIERLYEQLMSLKMTIQRGAVAAVAIGALAFATQEASAQNFGAPQTNPFGLTQVLGYGNSKPIFVDIDGDGDMDIISGQAYPNDFNYYENTGTNTAPVYAPVQTNPFGLTSLGYYAGTPTFVDIDGDGDLDMIAGFGYYYDYYGPNSKYGGFMYYQNTGTSTAPVFAAPVLNPFGLTEVGGYGYSAPTFADLDHDGDMDMISGEYYGNFKYYQNTGDSLSPAFAAPVTNPFGLSGIGYDYSTPSLIDIDGDGDFDIISGGEYLGGSYPNYIGGFAYYENTGDSANPVFAPKTINPFGLTDPGNAGEDTAPTLVDLDGDGDLDLLTGINDGDLIYYPGCSPSTATISPTAVCSYTSPSGKIWETSNTYMDTIPNASGCDSVITINLTINPIADQTIANTTVSACDGGAATIDLISQSGVNYYLRDNTNDTIVDGPIAGTGSGISLSTGVISSPMIYNVYGDRPTYTKGLFFDGQSAFNTKVDCGNDPSVQLSGNQITLEAWIYPTAWRGVNQGHIINKEFNGGSGNDLGYMIRCGDGGKINFNLGNGNWNEVTTTTTPLVLNQWQHVAATYDGAVMSIYVDGVLIETKNTTVNFSAPNNNLTIGSWAGGNGSIFAGTIDEVRVWSVSKTQNELQADMNNCLTGSETGLVAYYQFEDGIGSSTLTDLTANGNDGTLMNMDVNNDWKAGSAVCSTCNMQMSQTVTANIGQSTTGTISPTACISYTSPSGNYVWTSSNTYLDTIPNLAGCDSVITVNLTINAVDTSTSTVGFDITSNQSGATYRWLDCNNSNSVIPSETGITYTATANGDYAVEVTINGCIDTSACVSITTIGLDALSVALGNLKLYPNPTTGNVVLDLGVITNAQVSVLDITGKEVYSLYDVNDKQVQILTEEFSKGVYFVKIQSDNQQKILKLIKQ